MFFSSVQSQFSSSAGVQFLSLCQLFHTCTELIQRRSVLERKSLHLFDLNSILLAVESSLQVSSCLMTRRRPRHLTVSSIKCWYSSLAQIQGLWIILVCSVMREHIWSVQPLPKTIQDTKTLMLLLESLMFQQIVSYGLDQTENKKKK